MTAPAPRVGALLAGAAEWRLLSLLLSRPHRRWHEEVTEAASEVGDAALRRAATETCSARERAYDALLGAGGRASPREAAHVGSADPAPLLADLGARYAAFGFAPHADGSNDHLAVECEFLSHLCRAEADALSAGERDRAERAREARARFLCDHAATAGRRFAPLLPPRAPRYLLLAAEALVARLPAAPPERDGGSPSDPLAGRCPAADGCPVRRDPAACADHAARANRSRWRRLKPSASPKGEPK